MHSIVALLLGFTWLHACFSVVGDSTTFIYNM